MDIHKSDAEEVLRRLIINLNSILIDLEENPEWSQLRKWALSNALSPHQATIKALMEELE